MDHRIGLFVGSFNPVHEGHESFVNTALRELSLEKVIVVPEESPRNKQNVSSAKHRIAMLQQVFDSKHVEVRTLDAPYASFPEAFDQLGLRDRVFLLIGSDVAFTLKTWKNLGAMLKQTQLVIGVRNQNDISRIHTLMAHMEIHPSQYHIVLTAAETSSSSQSKNTRQYHPKIKDYIQKHHLYTV